jgi:redox-sensitive bicupin YhaK (pirin superfamily)
VVEKDSFARGDVQWMTVGCGIFHDEFHSDDFTHQRGFFQMAQLWVNLPAKDQDTPPKYQTLAKDVIPELQLPAGAGTVRVIAGQCGDVQDAAKTFSPVDLWDIRLPATKRSSSPRKRVRRQL